MSVRILYIILVKVWIDWLGTWELHSFVDGEVSTSYWNRSYLKENWPLVSAFFDTTPSIISKESIIPLEQKIDDEFLAGRRDLQSRQWALRLHIIWITPELSLCYLPCLLCTWTIEVRCGRAHPASGGLCLHLLVSVNDHRRLLHMLFF